MKDASPLEVDCLQRLQYDDETAISTLMKIYYNDLYHYASRFCNDAPMIKDCIQEVFISLWQRRASASTILSPRYYFLRAVKNKVLKALHQQNVKGNLRSIEQEYGFIEELSIETVLIDKQVSDEKARKLQNTLSLLSQRQKEVVYLKYYQHLDNGQIAELMNISRQSVYNLLHETIQRLKKILEADYLLR